jgi:hypothetical protein
MTSETKTLYRYSTNHALLITSDLLVSCVAQLFGPHRKASRSKSITVGNTDWLHVEYKGWPHVFIIAREDIAAGTELTIDYSEG